MATVKRGKWQRKAAKSPNPFLTPPPDPEVSAAMAAGGIPLARGASDQVPLSNEGQKEAKDIGKKIANKGGLDALTTSASARATQTAAPIIADNPKEMPVDQTPELGAWNMGQAEGEPETPEIRAQLRDLIRKNPSTKIPGKGAVASAPGESFDDWRQRYLPAIRAQMQMLAQSPDKKLGVLTHSSGMKLTKAWLKKGSPDDFSVDNEAMDFDKSQQPAQVERLYPNDKGEWEMKPVNLDDKKAMEPGIYMIRHAATPWTVDQNQKTDEGMSALAKIAKNTRLMDFKGVKEAADKAASKGHLTDDEITAMIDKSLPDRQTAADLPHDQLMAAAAAASPAKRAEYEPLLRERFAGIGTLPPDSQHQLVSHLGRIGIRGVGRSNA